MKIRREFKTCFISLILLTSLLSAFVIIPEDAKADFTEGTTLYFHDFFSSFGEMNRNEPTAENGSAWPPDISNIEEWIVWFYMWLGFKDIDIDLDQSYLEQLGISPFKITGFYEYPDEEILEIEGDVEFNLYFSSTLLSKIVKDEVKVDLCHYKDYLDFFDDLPPLEKYDTTTKIKSTLSREKTQLTTISIGDVDFELSPEEILTFSVEIIPSDKFIREIVEKMNQTKLEELIGLIEPLAEVLTNQTLIPELSGVGDLVDFVLNQSEIFLENLTLVADLVNDILSSSFVYDSVEHPSSVTLPGDMPGYDDEEENVKKYYLHSGGTMDEDEPTGEMPSEVSLSDISQWDGPNLETSKVIKEASASLYIEHQNILRLINILRGKIEVTARLLYENNEIASSQKLLDWTIFLNILSEPQLMIFNFDNLGEYEIKHGSGLSLEVSSDVGGESIGKYAKLFCDSIYYASYLAVEFDETEHIRVTSEQPSSREIALGESVVYNLSVVSDRDEDEVKLAIVGFDEKAKWDIDLPGSFNLTAGVEKSVEIVVTSTYTEFDSDAYDTGEELTVGFAVYGKNGRAVYDAVVEVSEDAVEYDIIVVSPKAKEIRHGENGTYVFKIINNNTGFWSDSYSIEISSANKWLTYEEKYPTDVDVGDEVEISATISVPEYTDVSSDKLTFTVKSKESNEKTYVAVEVTTTVIGPNIVETMYHFFETLGEDVGLADTLGSSFYAALILAAIAFIIIFIIIIVLIYFLTIKYINLVCFERIKEVSPEGAANFEITIHNPFKRTLSYKIDAQNSSSSSPEQGWKVFLDTESVTLESKQSKKLILTVKPTDYVKPDDWVEVKVKARALEKNKKAKLSVVTTIKDAKPDLNIVGVFHWPRAFKKGDRVVTSFKLRNNGNAAAKVSVILYLNGEEKNKVEDITIPSGGYADIEIPWIAVKGKNDIDIVVK